MKNFVGIDLGTTNSAICSYDGSETRTWKSCEQNDVTPSAILIARRGNKYIGTNAYDNAPWQHESAALLFKRLMGTSTPIELSGVGITMTPEECSAEMLKLLYGYLPEELRNDPDVGTVITVPAAFNLMQKDATMQAANMAGIGKVALMQEPVAAVMSVIRARNTDGMFLIYDLGGGTLDIAIAETINGRVSLLAHGGIAMCGGRDFDRLIMDNIVKPWLFENFDLPDNFSADPNFEKHKRVALWAIEKTKIELSSKEDTIIFMDEAIMRCRDLVGTEMYLEVPLSRDQFDQLIAEKTDETIEAARETLSKAGLSPHDLERIVFVGGPTNYKPLREKIAFELGIPGSLDVNPMTAVAEGASLFAESIDWSTQHRSRKNIRGQISSGCDLGLSFNFTARTPETKAKIAVHLGGRVLPGSEFQIDSIDTGWTSGRLPLKHSEIVDVMLTKTGENAFKIFVFDSVGGPITLEQDKIIITRTAATVDAIPASHSIFIEVLDKLGGIRIADFLVKAGDNLPVKGKRIYKASESLKAGSTGSLSFNVWEGDIEDPITDNRPVGYLKISGSDFSQNVIHAGANLECEYEILDSGNIVLEVSVSCISGVFSQKNLYFRHGIQVDAAMVAEESQRTLSRIETINKVVDDPKLDRALQKLESAVSIDPDESDTEKSQEAMEKVFEARRLLAQVRKEHLKVIRQIDLDLVGTFFDEHVRQYAHSHQESAFDNLAKTTQRSIDRNDKDVEHHIDKLRVKNFEILWWQDWFVIDEFKGMIGVPYLFVNKGRFDELSQLGSQLIRSDDIDKLRSVVAELYSIKVRTTSEDALMDVANIIKG